MAVRPELLNMIEDSATAAESWENVRILFEDDTTSRRAELEKDLTVLPMLQGESSIKFIGLEQGLRNDLATAGMPVV